MAVAHSKQLEAEVVCKALHVALLLLADVQPPFSASELQHTIALWQPHSLDSLVRYLWLS